MVTQPKILNELTARWSERLETLDCKMRPYPGLPHPYAVGMPNVPPDSINTIECEIVY